MTGEELQRQVVAGNEARDALSGITGRNIEECLQDILQQIVQTPGTEAQTLSLLKQSYDTLVTFKNRMQGFAQVGLEAEDILNGIEAKKTVRVL